MTCEKSAIESIANGGPQSVATDDLCHMVLVFFAFHSHVLETEVSLIRTRTVSFARESDCLAAV